MERALSARDAALAEGAEALARADRRARRRAGADRAARGRSATRSPTAWSRASASSREVRAELERALARAERIEAVGAQAREQATRMRMARCATRPSVASRLQELSEAPMAARGRLVESLRAAIERCGAANGAGPRRGRAARGPGRRDLRGAGRGRGRAAGGLLAAGRVRGRGRGDRGDLGDLGAALRPRAGDARDESWPSRSSCCASSRSGRRSSSGCATGGSTGWCSTSTPSLGQPAGRDGARSAHGDARSGCSKALADPDRQRHRRRPRATSRRGAAEAAPSGRAPADDRVNERYDLVFEPRRRWDERFFRISMQMGRLRTLPTDRVRGPRPIGRGHRTGSSGLQYDGATMSVAALPVTVLRELAAAT